MPPKFSKFILYKYNRRVKVFIENIKESKTINHFFKVRIIGYK